MYGTIQLFFNNVHVWISCCAGRYIDSIGVDSVIAYIGRMSSLETIENKKEADRQYRSVNHDESLLASNTMIHY